MNSSQLSSQPSNPFTRSAFWGRQNELQTIYKRLLTELPQCCAIIGETSIGKTTLMRYLSNPQNAFIIDNMDKEHGFTFVYLDCDLYLDLAIGDQASVQFWSDLYREALARLQPNQPPTLLEPTVSSNQHLIDTAFEIKSELEQLIRGHQDPVIFLLDNFEGIARLPLRDSEWLRSLAQHHCAYIVSSRHLLYLLYQYHPGSWATPSPLWNLFSDPIYLGLMREYAVQDFLSEASKQAKELGSFWRQRDIDFIRKVAGRHAELIRIACSHLFEKRLQSLESEKNEFEDEFLELSIAKDASAICNQLWHGLADSELSGEPRIPGYSKERGTRTLSPYQQGLIDVAKGYTTPENEMLFVLEQRGLIERVNGKWCVFAEVMRQFVLKQEQVHTLAKLTAEKQVAATEDADGTEAIATRKMTEPTREHQPAQASTQTDFHIEQREVPVFSYLEGKVYEYLKSHGGEVCDREEIKWAVWGEKNEPSNSALQKIIERIREKIEPDPENPRYLIAVRGQGYMLREDTLGSSSI